MPINKNWQSSTKDRIQSRVPEKPGVYELRAFGEFVYIGSSDNLQRRLLEHEEERNPNEFRFKSMGFFDQLVSSPVNLEREHFDRYVEKYGEPPRWNQKRP